MKITYKMVMEKEPCYDPHKKYGISKRFKCNLIDVFGMKQVPRLDKIWLVIKFLPEIEQRKFAIWCARRCKTDKKEVADYIDAIEGHYIHGTVTYEAMSAAYSAADSAAYSAAYRAAYSAACRAECESQLRKLRSIVKGLK